jgi:drug/metabolite transporter (DMT)-like permease
VTLNISRGMRFMAYAAFWLSVMGMLVKLVGQRLPSMEIVFVRAVITLLLSWFLIRREKIDPWQGPRKLLLLRGFLGAAALTCFYYSLIHLPLAEATVIQYMNPLLVSVLATTMLGERPTRRERLAVFLSLLGVFFIARPAAIFGGERSLPTIFVAVAVLGSVFSSFAYVTVRQLRHHHNPLVVVFYFPLVTVPLALPFAVAGWKNPTPIDWLLLIGIGVTTQIAQVYLTRGLQLEEATRATTMGYAQILFAVLWGYLVFRQLPDGWSAVGAIIIAASTLSVLYQTRTTRAAPV